jgi:hypothetical protein
LPLRLQRVTCCCSYRILAIVRCNIFELRLVIAICDGKLAKCRFSHRLVFVIIASRNGQIAYDRPTSTDAKGQKRDGKP